MDAEAQKVRPSGVRSWIEIKLLALNVLEEENMGGERSEEGKEN
jgi:hypothetical protein